MALHRWPLLVIAAVFLVGCTDAGLTAPEETLASPSPPSAKPKKDKPAPPEIALEEYWVYRDGTTNLIHVAGTGDIDEVNPLVVFDYFFNGIRDDDPRSESHFEYYYPGPPPTSVTPLADGRWEADIPWDGERGWDAGPYRDMLITDLGGGADPFAFELWYKKNGETVGRDVPTGIRAPGVDPDVHVATLPDIGEVTSYGVFKGGPAADSVYLSTFSVDLESVSCRVTKERVGRGKTATTVTVRSITADFELGFGVTTVIPLPEHPPNLVWTELHFIDGESRSSRIQISPNQLTVAGTITGSLPGGPSSTPVELVVDYVNPTSLYQDYVYNPGLNSNAGFRTTAGFGEIAWSNDLPVTQVNKERFPVARVTLPVTCN